MTPPDLADARALLSFIDASPSPFHACVETARQLEAAGFRRVDEEEAWSPDAGRYYISREGGIAAWVVAEGTAPTAGFKIIGAHTDSPNLRVKPRADTGRAGYRQLGVEVYGGVLLNTWLDRDLGLSGRVMVRGSNGPESRYLLVQRPILRVPQLAIHLDREINTKGLLLNKQTLMAPVWALGGPREEHFVEFLAAELDVAPKDVMTWDVMCHDTNPSTVWGLKEEFISAPRLDNLASCFSGLQALLAIADSATADSIPAVTFFDHEEVGSSSRRGAGGPILKDWMERSVLARGGGREDFHRAIASSICVSADMAHATHPNYVDRHEPDHFLEINAGPVIKVNSNQRYASEAETEAVFQTACETAGVPFQKWVNRTDLACGSTIGPITASVTGIKTVDVGNPMLAMHSIREMAGSQDPGLMRRAMAAFLAS